MQHQFMLVFEPHCVDIDRREQYLIVMCTAHIHEHQIVTLSSFVYQSITVDNGVQAHCVPFEKKTVLFPLL
jgi:hypothetical protein